MGAKTLLGRVLVAGVAVLGVVSIAVAVTPAGATSTSGISGTVTTSSSATPLEGVCVTVFPVTGTTFAQVPTGPDGTYTATLPAGRYWVEFRTATHCISYTTPGPGYVAQYWRDAPTRAAATEVTVTATHVTSTIGATLVEAGGIEGTAKTGSGTPLPFVCVHVERVLGTGKLLTVATTFTSTGGTYSIAGLSPAAKYVVLFATTQCTTIPENYLTQYYDGTTGGTRDSANAEQLTVAAGTFTTSIDATMEPGGEITGTVENASETPVQTICVEAFGPSRTTGSGGVFTTTTGTYLIEGLYTGTYKVLFSECAPISGRYISQYYKGKATYTRATAVSVTESHTTPTVDATLVEGGTLKGQVTTSEVHATATAVCVDVDQGTTEVATAVTGVITGHGGSWSVNLAAGTYTVTYHSGCGSVGGYVTEVTGPLNVKTGETTTTTVALTPGTAPSFTTHSPPTTAQVGSLYSYAFVVTGDPAPTCSFAGSAPPTWLHLATATGTCQVSGAPPRAPTSSRTP